MCVSVTLTSADLKVSILVDFRIGNVKFNDYFLFCPNKYYFLSIKIL